MKFKEDEIAIEVHNLNASYSGKPALWDIDFEVPKGKLIGLIGPNGSGKTTLFKSILGLIPIDSGHVKIFNRDLDEVRNLISYVPQRESVDWDFPASVMDVVLMGRYTPKKIFKRLSQEDKSIAAEALKKVNMLEFANRQISQLSGGQQQRVFIARALAQQADIYLMDEPFVGVDASTETAILELLTEMKENGKTVFVIHHDLQTAAEYFDWIVLINTRLVANGPIKEVFTKENIHTAFGGKLTILSKIADTLMEKEFPIREKDIED